jgi:drug/metabolite transporter (DMT)-like permease
MRIITVLILSSLCATGGTMLLKIGAQGREQLIDFFNLPLIVGFAIYGIGSLLWIYALSKAPVTTVHPFTALTFILVISSAFVFLHERPTAFEWLGIALILAGLGVIVTAKSMT